jgi:diphthamide biosynthesis protein 2
MRLCLKRLFIVQIALQFPDELMSIASTVYSALLARVEGEQRKRSIEDGDRHLFVLGDTSYGSCCVDLVAARHANADCIIHYGRACMTSL